MKIENFCAYPQENKNTEWEKTFESHTAAKGLVYRIHKRLL